MPFSIRILLTLALNIFPDQKGISLPGAPQQTHPKRWIRAETACETGRGNAFLRGEGLYSSLISEWRKQRDAGLLEGKNPGDAVGRPSWEQAENARLKAQLRKAEKERDTAEAALEIMGKLHALLEQISESADTGKRPGKR